MQIPPGAPPQPYAQLATYSEPRYNPWAIVSISFAVSTAIGTCGFGGLVAVITGHIARHQIKRTGESGASLALAGLIAGYVAMGLFALFVVAYILFFVFAFAFAAAHPPASPTPGASI